MSRCHFLAGTAAAAAVSQVIPAPASGTPNILHIMVDQMQAAVIAGRSGVPHPAHQPAGRRRSAI
jgi:hypothetical protein